MKMFCDVYKGTKKEGLYIYVNREEGLDRVPQDLMKKFGEPSLALSFVLTAERRLAKEDPEKVLAAINDNGFYLQLPPQEYTI